MESNHRPASPSTHPRFEVWPPSRLLPGAGHSTSVTSTHHSPLTRTASMPCMVDTACSEAVRGRTGRWCSWLGACVQPPRPRLLNLAEVDRKPPVRRFSASLCQKVKPTRGFLRVLPYPCQRTHERTCLSRTNVGLELPRVQLHEILSKHKDCKLPYSRLVGPIRLKLTVSPLVVCPLNGWLA